VIADPASTSAWSFGGSILTFVFPMLLFIVVACALYIAYTKPETGPRPPQTRPAHARRVLHSGPGGAGPPPRDGKQRGRQGRPTASRSPRAGELTSPAAVSAGTPGTLGSRPGGPPPGGAVVVRAADCADQAAHHRAAPWSPRCRPCLLAPARRAVHPARSWSR